MERLANQTIIVTGGGRGIGRAIALRFAREGATVVIAEREAAAGEQAAKAARELGAEALFIPTDLARLDDIEQLASKVHQRFGRIDGLVNNAAVTRSLDFFAVSEADWDWINNVNAKGLFFCMQRIAKVMKEQAAGKIINIASIAGKGYPLTSNIAYAGSKGAVIAMTRVAAHALGPFNINVNAICPGVTRTELYHEVVKGKAAALGKPVDDIIATFDRGIPIGRSNTPEDIADLAVFLASSEASNVTGQSWNVDGGLLFD